MIRAVAALSEMEINVRFRSVNYVKVNLKPAEFLQLSFILKCEPSAALSLPPPPPPPIL